jgi:uncharacterized protein DUF2760
MSRVGVAIWAFFAALASSQKAELIRAALSGAALPKLDMTAKTQPAPRLEPPARSEAITLLASLQREARLVDLVKQPLGEFSDEQIGAAARNVLTDSAAVLDRFFALRPVIAGEEGADCVVPSGYDPAKFKLAGNPSGPGPYRGKLSHHGWQASSAKLPTWTGSHDAALVIAPAEVDV